MGSYTEARYVSIGNNFVYKYPWQPVFTATSNVIHFNKLNIRCFGKYFLGDMID